VIQSYFFAYENRSNSIFIKKNGTIYVILFCILERNKNEDENGYTIELWKWQIHNNITIPVTHFYKHKEMIIIGNLKEDFLKVELSYLCYA
jgi:hypothetical protein